MPRSSTTTAPAHTRRRTAAASPTLPDFAPNSSLAFCSTSTSEGATPSEIGDWSRTLRRRVHHPLEARARSGAPGAGYLAVDRRPDIPQRRVRCALVSPVRAEGEAADHPLRRGGGPDRPTRALLTIASRSHVPIHPRPTVAGYGVDSRVRSADDDSLHAQESDRGQRLGARVGFGEHGEVRFARDDFGARDTGFTYHRTNPNVHGGFGHHHQAAEEVYVVLSGSGRVKLDDDIVEIQRLDTIRVAPAVWRSFSAAPKASK